MSGNMTISDADRARWRALAEAATPGPWWPDHRCVGVGSDDPSQGEAAGLGWEVLRDRGTRERAWPEPSLRGTFARGWDAHFVAEARTALPALLDENDRLRATLEAVGASAVHTTDDLVPDRAEPTRRADAHGK